MTTLKRRWPYAEMTRVQRDAAERRIKEIEAELNAIRSSGSSVDILNQCIELIAERSALEESLDEDDKRLRGTSTH